MCVLNANLLIGINLKSKMEECKVVGCKNSAMEGNFGVVELRGNYGYCQIHNIEGCVKTVKGEQDGN